MLSFYFLQLWFILSDPAVEETLYDSVAMRSFVGIDLGVEGAPDETTLYKFRHLKDGERDQEMHQTAKGKQWYFGMQADIGVDRRTKLTHTILAAAAKMSDVLALPHLLHDKETRIWGDQGYRGQKVAMR